MRVIVLAWVLLIGCSNDRRVAPDTGTVPVDASPDASDVSPGDTATADTSVPAPFVLTSTAFEEGGMVPLTHECGPPIIADGPGDNVTPPLSWGPGPTETMSYAIVMRDTDAGDLVHWVIYDIPSSVLALPEGVTPGYEPDEPVGSKQAEIQASGYYGYFGPCSPGRVNTYQWTLHALDTPTLEGVARTSTEDDVAAAVEAASIASTALSGES
jgi:hypothetical protein